MIERFESVVSDEAVADLKKRIAATRWPEFLEGVGWSYGADQEFFRNIAAYWLEGFDWRAQETEWKRIPQFLFTHEGTRIHFCHLKGKGNRPLPLLLTHGWPGSFLEFLKIIPMLTDPAAYDGSPDDSFDVVVPSIPGFGF